MRVLLNLDNNYSKFTEFPACPKNGDAIVIDGFFSSGEIHEWEEWVKEEWVISKSSWHQDETGVYLEAICMKS